MNAQRLRHRSIVVYALGAAIGLLALDARAADDVVLDNQTLGDDMARKDAADRRAKYQGDSPFADDATRDDSYREWQDRREQEHEKQTRFRPLALTANPLTLVLGRIGANIEYLPVPHHGIMVNPYYSSVTVETTQARSEYEFFGGELGYHFYTGKKGANGFFVGPSFVYMRTTSSSECLEVGCSVEPEIDFTTYGVALDLGGQVVFDNGITLGAGGGLMYLRSSGGAEGGSLIKFQGTLPRILFTIGYSI
jgi:hypothetical protein